MRIGDSLPPRAKCHKLASANNDSRKRGDIDARRQCTLLVAVGALAARACYRHAGAAVQRSALRPDRRDRRRREIRRRAARPGLPYVGSGLDRWRAAGRSKHARHPLDRVRQFRTVLQRPDHPARCLFRSRQQFSAARLQGRRRQARRCHPDRACPPRPYVGRGVGRHPDRRHHRRRAADDGEARYPRRSIRKSSAPSPAASGITLEFGAFKVQPILGRHGDPPKQLVDAFGGRAARNHAQADRRAACRVRHHPVARRAGSPRRHRRHACLSDHAR